MRGIFATGRAQKGPPGGWCTAPIPLLFLLLPVLPLASPFPAAGWVQAQDTPASADEENTFGQWTVRDLQVRSMRVHENYLLLDDQPYLLTGQEHCVNADGKTIPPSGLPESGTVDIRYERRPKDEEHPQGGRERILLEIRLRSTPKAGGAGR